MATRPQYTHEEIRSLLLDSRADQMHTPNTVMNNTDPTNEFMYQLPPGTHHRSEADAIDPIALKERLQLLGLEYASRETLSKPGEEETDHGSSSSTSSPAIIDYRSLNHPNNPYLQHSGEAPAPAKSPLRRYPTVHEVFPEDSISMYKPRPGGRLPPVEAIQASSIPLPRRGGTDVDPGEAGEAYLSEEYEQPPMTPYSADGLTAATTRSLGYLDPTVGLGSAFTRGTTHGGMAAMRDRLLAEQAEEEAAKKAELAAHLTDTARLAATAAKLEAAEEQLRTLQATLIAERVARTQIQQKAATDEENMRECREELASAIRALRRSRDEGKRSEEDRKALVKAYEVAQAKLHKYQLEMSVREATARGRAYGRQEAWDEAARWMGAAPPLPIQPIQQIPETVLRQTPRMEQESFDHGRPFGQGQPASNYTPDPHQHRQDVNMPIPHPNVGHGGHIRGGTDVSPDDFGQSNSSGRAQGGTNQRNTSNNYPQAPADQTQNSWSQHRNGMQQPHPMPHNVSSSDRPPPTYNNTPHTGPHQYSQVLSQHPGRPATTVTQDRRHVSQPTPQASRPPNTQRSSSTFAPRPETAQRCGAADSYLDRVEHDQRLQKMLSGAPSKYIHTSQFPPSESGDIEKPLPNPHTSQPNGRANTMHSTAPNYMPHGGRSRRRQSLSEGMHPEMLMHSIPDGDRYPVFPGAAPHGGLAHVGHRHGHSHSTSFNSVDPTGYALPPSTLQSTEVTSHPPHRQAPSTSRHTPQSQSARVRSRMAGALRNDGDLSHAELSQIEEEDARRTFHGDDAAARREQDFQQSAIMRNVSGQTPKSRQRAPSLPPPRHQPRPVMPGMLGKSASEYQPSGPHPPAARAQTQAFYAGQGGGHGIDDQPMSYPMHMAPHLDPIGVNGGADEIGSHRHSALGLEGMGAQSRPGVMNALGHGLAGGPGQGQTGGEGHGKMGGLLERMKAPTITIQPPSSHTLSNLQSQQAQAVPLAASNTETRTEHIEHPTKRQTTIITEYFESPPQPQGQVVEPLKPHEIPLPRSRANTLSSDAPPVPILLPTPVSAEATTRVVLPHEVPLPRSRAGIITILTTPPQVPLPPSRSVAPTAYEGTPPDLLSPKTDRSHRSRRSTRPDLAPATHGRHQQMPSVSVIDYAVLQPLPESRATTMFGTPQGARLTAETEENTRKNERAGYPSTEQHRATHPDPRQVPLPASRAPSARPRASTYARTEGTIDEVTEEESGRENRDRSKRW